jgi:uncharacterized repeat protein (TIGR01451 family)
VLLALLLGAGCSGTSPHSAAPATSQPPPQPQPPPPPPPPQSEAPFFGLLRNTDPHAVKLDVRALPCSNAVGGQCVLIATVVDEQGKPLRGKRVEWTLEGAGQILSADSRGGLFTSRGKLESRYAVTETGRSAVRVPRNTGKREDEIVLDTGETWCVITAAVEGESRVTVHAPDVADSRPNVVNVSQRWYDSAYTLPQPQGGRPGDRVPLVTRLFHQADNQALPGHWVRYRYLDGPQVLLLPTGAHEALVVSDAAGLATATAYQATPQGGRTRLSVEVLRPDPRGSAAPPVVVGRGEAVIEWQAPAIALTHTGPVTVPVNQDATFNIAVRNSAATATPAFTVRAALPDDAVVGRTDPQAIREGSTLIWTLGALAGGATRELHFTVRSPHTGALTSRASVVTIEGLTDEQTVTADVVPPPKPELVASLSAPPAAVVSQGVNGGAASPVNCVVTLRNPGTGPATNVVLSAVFRNDLLEHESKKYPVEIAVGTLRPGEARTVSLVLTPRGPGETPVGVTAKADGGLSAKTDGSVKVVETGLVLKMTGPPTRHVGLPAEWTLEVQNTGQVPLQQVAVRDLLPPEMQFVEAPRGNDTPEGRPLGNEVVWEVGTLRPKDVRVLKLVTKGTKSAAKAVNSAVASGHAATEPATPGDANGVSLGIVQTKADAMIALQGVSALDLKVKDTVDPIHVGEKTTYTIKVTNSGSLDTEHVQVVGKVPPQMRVVAVYGPGGYRVVGDRLEFQPVDKLAPGAVLNYGVDVEATKAGDVRFHVELSSSALKEPMVKEESTIVR